METNAKKETCLKETAFGKRQASLLRPPPPLVALYFFRIKRSNQKHSNRTARHFPFL